jgi:hypothetical protein
MKGTPPAVAELEAELVRLNTLVRARRRQLERLQACPNEIANAEGFGANKWKSVWPVK